MKVMKMVAYGSSMDHGYTRFQGPLRRKLSSPEDAPGALCRYIEGLIMDGQMLEPGSRIRSSTAKSLRACHSPWRASPPKLGHANHPKMRPKERRVVPKMGPNEGPGRAWGPPGELLHRSGSLWVALGGLRGDSVGAEGAERGQLGAKLVRRWGHQ